MPSSPQRPFSDAYLMAYADEHVVYEFEMFLWLARVCGGETRIGAPSASDVARLNNALIESFVVHLRNVIDFIYPESRKPTDVVAEDFFAPGEWTRFRPKRSRTLTAARVRANKEIAHLTTDRFKGNPPEKGWDFASLAAEIRLLIRLFAGNALAVRLSPKVSAVIT
jgi:hypothetical protein